MVIDTSVLIAILANEPEAELFEAAIDADPIRLISAASVLEAAIVAGARYGDIGGRELDLLLYKAQIQIVAVTPDQVYVGRHAFSKYRSEEHTSELQSLRHLVSRLLLEKKRRNWG